MAKYRKKPVVIDAMQYTEDSREQIIEWCDPRHHSMDEEGCLFETSHLFIKTLEGEMMAKLGDWIIQGIRGEFYPCKPDIFEATYEPVDG